MTIIVNEKSRAVNDDASLDDLLVELQLKDKFGIAVAVNDTVIVKSDWEDQKFQENDKVLVITATQGG